MLTCAKCRFCILSKLFCAYADNNIRIITIVLQWAQITKKFGAYIEVCRNHLKDKDLKSFLFYVEKDTGTKYSTYPNVFQKSIFIYLGIYTVFENHRKSLIQHCKRSELRLHFEWTKFH